MAWTASGTPSTATGRCRSSRTRCWSPLAYYLAFRLRFLETEGGVPERYDDMLWGSIGFVVVGKLIVFAASASTRSGGATSACRDCAAMLQGGWRLDR